MASAIIVDGTQINIYVLHLLAFIFCSGCFTSLEVICPMVFSYWNRMYPIKQTSILSSLRDSSQPYAYSQALQYNPFSSTGIYMLSYIVSAWVCLFLLVELSEERDHMIYLSFFPTLHIGDIYYMSKKKRTFSK